MKNFNNQKKINKLKTLIKLKINIFYNFKVLKFQHKKWQHFLIYFKNQLKFSKFNKYKVIDQNIVFINKKNFLELNYKNYYKKKFIFSKLFNKFFGNLSKKYYYNLNYKIKNFLNIKQTVIQKLESRLDLILYRSKFVTSIKFAKQFISNGHIFVNNKIIKMHSFILKSGDLVSLNGLINSSIVLADKLLWPAIFNFLVINYKTKQIIFINNFNKLNFSFYSFFYLNLHKFLAN